MKLGTIQMSREQVMDVAFACLALAGILATLFIPGLFDRVSSSIAAAIQGRMAWYIFAVAIVVWLFRTFRELREQ